MTGAVSRRPRAALMGGLRLIGFAAALAAAACGRFDHVGKPPPFTPAGQTLATQPPLAVERRAIATPRAAEMAALASPAAPTAPRVRNASLWRSGPASLFGDRRAQSRGDILTVVIEIDEEASISN
ncbi:MAG: flagellar basal body L-ring protein FlgH, partial [Pseudomonadota bacterium]